MRRAYALDRPQAGLQCVCDGSGCTFGTTLVFGLYFSTSYGLSVGGLSVTFQRPFASFHLYKTGFARGEAGASVLTAPGSDSGAKYHQAAAAAASSATNHNTARPAMRRGTSGTLRATPRTRVRIWRPTCRTPIRCAARSRC